uniref:MMS19 nucleotide excision repair protein n=1 Tax=Myripristis murdjan TaxID=586833 RepID=A0A667YA59_9TELE
MIQGNCLSQTLWNSLPSLTVTVFFFFFFLRNTCFSSYVSSPAQNKALHILHQVNNLHTFSIAGICFSLQVVKHLTLASQPHTRARGVQLLSHVLQECYGDLSEGEVEVLVAFYENRLKDHYVIIPHVLQGLQALTKCSVLPPGCAVSMLRSLFQDVHVQYPSSLLSSRLNLFFPTELKSLGADFVFGFVQSMDGEKDPRNLLLAFQIARNIIYGGYDLGKFAEELFEVTSCYFPIDFTPPPNDPHGITQEELILSLRGVLAGTPQFAEFLLPLIIEKLDSDVQSAKLDSLQTLVRKSLALSVFQTNSERVESAGLAALTALTSCLSRSVVSSDSDDALRAFLDLVLSGWFS